MRFVSCTVIDSASSEGVWTCETFNSKRCRSSLKLTEVNQPVQFMCKGGIVGLLNCSQYRYLH
jgi:hypothetical protein